jgi:eukaryotic-like serine/threonine-protein kinase
LEPNVPQHDETIVPVRPNLRGPVPERRAPAASMPRLVRLSLTALGGVALVVVAAAAFYWLPASVEEKRAAAVVQPAAAPAPEAPARRVLSAEESAALEARSGELLAGLLTLTEELRRLNPENWAAEEWAKYQQLSEAGDNAFLAKDFETSATSYAEAKALGEGLVARAATTIAESLAAADAALAAGDPRVAIERYDVVLAIAPTHAAAGAGRARAEKLPEVLSLVQRANVEVARGELQAALATYREALSLDADWPAAHAGVDQVNRMLRDAEYERLLSAGFGLLSSDDFAGARREFEAALELRPGSQEAADGLVQAEEAAKLNQIALAEARALAFERRELWHQAIELYRTVLEGDGTLLFAQTGLERAEARAGLDAKLANLIDNPTLLFSDSVLADARALLETAGAETQKGPRLTSQIERLGELVELASKPVPVRLESDQLTSVTVYRVGALGAFAAKDLELRPGTYTVIGSRDGYRDVRHTFTVRPGRTLPPISIVCVEPI